MPTRASPSWFVYVLRCNDGSLYTGIARDVAARLGVHASGKGARYTRGRGPFELLAQARCKGHGHALRVEIAVKALSREGKADVATPRKLGAFARQVTSSAKAKTATKPKKPKTATKPKKPKG